MAIPLHFSCGTTDGNDREIGMDVLVAIAHSAAIKEQRMIQNAAVTIRSGLQLLQEFREKRQMVRIDLGFFRDLLRYAIVVRNRMVSIRHTDLWITQRAELAGDHEGDDAG